MPPISELLSPPPVLPPCPILPHFIALLNADNWWQMDCAAHCASVALGVSCAPRAGKEGIGGKGEGSPCSSKAPGTGGWKSIQIRPLIGPDSARAVECGNPLSATHTAKLDDGAEEVQRGEGGPKTCYSTLFHIIKTTFGEGDKATLQTQNTHRIKRMAEADGKRKCYHFSKHRLIVRQSRGTVRGLTMQLLTVVCWAIRRLNINSKGVIHVWALSCTNTHVPSCFMEISRLSAHTSMPLCCCLAWTCEGPFMQAYKGTAVKKGKTEYWNK